MLPRRFAEKMRSVWQKYANESIVMLVHCTVETKYAQKCLSFHFGRIETNYKNQYFSQLQKVTIIYKSNRCAINCSLKFNFIDKLIARQYYEYMNVGLSVI